MSLALDLELSEELLDRIAERVAQLLAGQMDREPSGYLDVAAAAEFLACPLSRIYSLTSAGRLPVHRDGSRLLFDRRELRRFVADGGAKRP